MTVLSPAAIPAASFFANMVPGAFAPSKIIGHASGARLYSGPDIHLACLKSEGPKPLGTGEQTHLADTFFLSTDGKNFHQLHADHVFEEEGSFGANMAGAPGIEYVHIRGRFDPDEDEYNGKAEIRRSEGRRLIGRVLEEVNVGKNLRWFDYKAFFMLPEMWKLGDLMEFDDALRVAVFDRVYEEFDPRMHGVRVFFGSSGNMKEAFIRSAGVTNNVWGSRYDWIYTSEGELKIGDKVKLQPPVGEYREGRRIELSAEEVDLLTAQILEGK